MSESVFQGSLFSSDFLTDSITQLPDWSSIDAAALKALQTDLRKIYDRFPITKTPNESQTEDDLIWPVLVRMGWTSSLRQQNLAAKGRDDVPDGLLFADAAAKATANSFGEEWKRYGFGLAVVESKRWARPLDRRSGRRGEETAPSTQMLRYLRRVEDLTTGNLRWGILTNGGRWRLYYQGARSVSEQFFEVDLAAALDVPGHNEGLFALPESERLHWLKVFALVFRREAFLPAPVDSRTFHQRALEEGRFYEERVAGNLSNLVFRQVFPELAQAIAAAAPAAPLQQVREAALILLYRLLFILYAEDRDLLPVRDSRYDDYGLRDRVRGDVGKRKDRNDGFSTTAARYWTVIDDLCRAIDDGDASIGLPPYNGGLFNRDRTPLLASIRLGDAVMANVIDALSFEQTSEGRKYINYRDLSVQQLGSIYERLLEHEISREDGAIIVRPNIFARKGSGSYYTPDNLVMLILKETVEPLAAAPMKAFQAKLEELAESSLPEDRRLGTLKRLDPAEKLLDLKICDPAMGSGHFLVSLVDYLADQVIAAMAEAEATVADYVSPLSDRIDAIRNTILGNAEERGWTIDPAQLDDRHIIRRMVLKRCVYGVDKNAMAVELAKVSLWLHTFTVGAPLSFLDHHLRCGDSLFGSWVKGGIEKATAYGSPLLLHGPITRALRAASKMQIIEGLTDAEIAEAHRSADVYAEVQEMTAPLNALVGLIHAFEWLDIRRNTDRAVLRNAFFDGQFGDPMQIALGDAAVDTRREEGGRFAVLYAEARTLLDEEHFLNWQIAFPGIWSDWESEGLMGGFDAVIGNPPWDRMKLQQVEWFAARRREIALAERASDRERMVRALEAAGDPLSEEFSKADNRTNAAARMARSCGDYPVLAGGDMNIYSLFVERAMTIIKPGGMVGLLTPIGIATDKTSSKFFSERAVKGHIKTFLAFENRRGWLFPDIHHEEQPSVIIFGLKDEQFPSFDFCVRIATWDQFNNPDRRFTVFAKTLRQVNPNTGTAPMFRTRRDAEITTSIYTRIPVLVNRSTGTEVKTWPVRYSTMFHMTNDSALFRTRQELDEKEGAYLIGGTVFRSPAGDWVPLYEGKMIQLFNHRYASVRRNSRNVSGQGVTEELSVERLSDPAILPEPRFWVKASDLPSDAIQTWRIGFNDICNTNNARSLIAAAIPVYGCANTLPTFNIDCGNDNTIMECLLASLCSILCDYLSRQKIQSRHLNKYIVEQIPVIPPERYSTISFGRKTAAEIVREAVLELTYTAHNMAPFARDMGYVDDAGAVKPPFEWDEERRLNLRAKLDAVYFHLYGVTDRDDVRYIYSTFPIVEREEVAAFGGYRSRDLCLSWMSALSAGDPDAKIRA